MENYQMLTRPKYKETDVLNCDTELTFTVEPRHNDHPRDRSKCEVEDKNIKPDRTKNYGRYYEVVA